MKTKINVIINKLGEHTPQILSIIANHNEGKREITLPELNNYLKVRDALYPTTTNDLGYLNIKHPETILLISNDKGETYSLILSWNEINELNTITEQDLVN